MAEGKDFSNHKTTSHDKPGGKRVNKTDYYSDTRELILQTCRLHEEPMNTYCFDCNSLICHDCITKYHHDHSHQIIKIQQYTAECHLKPKTSAFITKYRVDLTKGNQYHVKYTPTVRGRHELTVTVNGQEVAGSPFPVFVSIHPTKLGKPVRVISQLARPAGVAINSEGEIIVAEFNGDVLTLDREGKRLRSIKRTDHNLKCPRGVAVDEKDNIYFVDLGQLYRCDKHMKISKRRVENWGHFCVTVIRDKVMVCEFNNGHKIKVYNKELEYVREIAPLGMNPGVFTSIASNERGNLYVSDTSNSIHVFSNNGDLLSSFDCEGNEFKTPYMYGVCVSGQYVYVTNFYGHNISVFTTEGEYVTSFGQEGSNEGDFKDPWGVCVDKDGFVYVCDNRNDRIQLF